VSYDPSQVAFVDTETFGLDVERHMPWEVAVIVDGEEHVWQIFWPQSVIDDAEPIALEISGFKDRSIQLRDELDPYMALLTPKASVLRFAELTQGRHLVGAVVSFDEERLRRMHTNVLGYTDRFPWHYHVIDVEALAVGHLHGERVSVGGGCTSDVATQFQIGLPWSSDDLTAALGVEAVSGDERHTALGDARWAKRMFEAVMGS